MNVRESDSSALEQGCLHLGQVLLAVLDGDLPLGVFVKVVDDGWQVGGNLIGVLDDLGRDSLHL